MGGKSLFALGRGFSTGGGGSADTQEIGSRGCEETLPKGGMNRGECDSPREKRDRAPGGGLPQRTSPAGEPTLPERASVKRNYTPKSRKRGAVRGKGLQQEDPEQSEQRKRKKEVLRPPESKIGTEPGWVLKGRTINSAEGEDRFRTFQKDLKREATRGHDLQLGGWKRA